MNPIEQLYTGNCTVSEYHDVTDPITKITKKQEAVVLTDQRCRLSFKNIPSASNGTVSQSIKLFVSPDITIKPGSKIVITQNGVTASYTRSGEPAIYTNHQEISLELFKGWI